MNSFNLIGCFTTASKQGHIYLRGRAHYDKSTGTLIETPRVQIDDKHIAPDGKIYYNKKTEIIKPATKQDIRNAKNIIKKRENND